MNLSTAKVNLNKFLSRRTHHSLGAKFVLFALFFVLSFSFSLALPVSITKFPENPKEGEDVLLKVESDKFDLNIAKITWFVDGIEVDSAIGRKTHTEKAPAGATKVVGVSLEQDGFEAAVTQTLITPNTSYVLYEGADSYVPPFYKGRRLPPQEGVVRVGAFSFLKGEIQGIKNFATQLKWTINGETTNLKDGDVKNVLDIQTGVTEKDVRIVVKSDTQDTPFSANVRIPLQKTELMFYKTDDKNLLTSPVLQTEKEKTLLVVVEPFFYSINNKRDPDLTYNWKLDDSPLSVSGPWFVKFESSAKNIFKIALNLVHNKKLTQENEAGFSLKTNQ